MSLRLFDSHAHLTYDGLFTSEVLHRAASSSVSSILNIITDDSDFERAFTIKTPSGLSIYHAAATTPHELTSEEDPFFETVAKAVQQKRLIAIGETGFDFFRNPSEKKHQEAVFLRYAQLASDSSLPMIIHCREGFDTLLPILKSFGPSLRGVIHCFTGTAKEASAALDLGWYISISGIVSFPKATMLRSIVQHLPLDAMLVETDAPYLAPEPHRGTTNEPAFLIHTVRAIAGLKNCSPEEIAEQTFLNANRLFVDKR